MQRKTSFLFYTIWPTELFFFLCQRISLEAFLTSIEFVGLGDFWDDKRRSLVQLRLHWQNWCYYHFSPRIKREGLSQTSTLLSWTNVLLESTEYVWYVKANKNINVIKQLAFFYVEHGVVVWNYWLDRFGEAMTIVWSWCKQRRLDRWDCCKQEVYQL